jgi:hypothetical protein
MNVADPYFQRSGHYIMELLDIGSEIEFGTAARNAEYEIS